jgi:hypothetical protein
MGEPWHLIQKRPACKAVLWRSSNYAVYGDMSRRVYEVLADRVPQVDPVRSAKTMSALDAINTRFGRGTLRPASTGIVRPWGARQQQLSPRYTTQSKRCVSDPL